MAQSKKKVTQAKNKTTKQTIVKGSGGLKTRSKWLGWKYMVPVVLIVALVGGFWVWRTSAASGNVFTRQADGMAGGITTKKVDGVSYRYIGVKSKGVETFLTATEARKSSQICAHYRAMGGTSSVVIQIGQKNSSKYFPDTRTTKVVKKGEAGHICLSDIVVFDSTVEVIVVKDHSLSGLPIQVGIDKIYGSR